MLAGVPTVTALFFTVTGSHTTGLSTTTSPAVIVPVGVPLAYFTTTSFVIVDGWLISAAPFT